MAAIPGMGYDGILGDVCFMLDLEISGVCGTHVTALLVTSVNNSGYQKDVKRMDVIAFNVGSHEPGFHWRLRGCRSS